MLCYYNETLTLDEFTYQILKTEQFNQAFILCIDREVFHTRKLHFTKPLPPKLIHKVDKIDLILIEQWQDLYDFISNLLQQSPTSSSEGIVIGLYGIFKHFIQVGHDYVPNRYLPNQVLYSARELNRLLHFLFVSTENLGIRVLINDSVLEMIEQEEEDDDGIPPLWKLSIPKVGTSMRQDSGSRRLVNVGSDNKDNDKDSVQLSIVFMKWVKL